MPASTTTANRNLKNEVYHILKERLINCVYPPGSIINEAQLSAELNLSRTPVREAISRLEMDGFIKIMPKKGLYVTDILLSNIIQLFQTRIEIEPITLRLAAPYLPEKELLAFCHKFEEELVDAHNTFRLDTAMHLFIIEHCGNQYLIDMMHRVFDENTRVIISSKQNQVQIRDTRMEHLEILYALLQKDVDTAEKLMKTHVESCRQAAFDYFYNQQVFVSPSPQSYKEELKKLDF